VVHSAAHNYETRGGHRGEHGSLDVVQARAPFVLAGRGVRADGLVDRSCRLVDVAPTLAELLGLPARGGIGLNGQPLAGAAHLLEDHRVRHEGRAARATIQSARDRVFDVGVDADDANIFRQRQRRQHVVRLADHAQ